MSMSFNSVSTHNAPCSPPGCVIAELFTEGVPLFDLSQLLAYRKGHFQTEHVLAKIEDHSILELVETTIHLDYRPSSTVTTRYRYNG